MNGDLLPFIDNSNNKTIGNQIRKIADQIREETALQIKVTSRILGAAAKISENNDRLIDEVVEMVEEDLVEKENQVFNKSCSVEDLKKRYKTLKEAKLQLGIKANGWVALVSKLNGTTYQNLTSTNLPVSLILNRLDTLEAEISALRLEVSQLCSLLKK
ncbi:MAG: hypothetical protein MH252_20245 [Thermosynechococcaceae cyanobacterium MS004]|nr:hypothetical protein [Thermosynechococcaceae cyanobacterium MS004]